MPIYNRFDPADNVERIDFRADEILQSAELNELQSIAAHRIKSVSDAIFKNGDLIRDAGIRVSPEGVCHISSGAIYLRGTVRGVPDATLTIPLVGTVVIGIYLTEHIVSELDDPKWLNPAVGSRGYGEPGAMRALLDPAWGIADDGTLGEFSAVYYVDDGVVRPKEPPPNLDAVSQALARYDRDSTGGAYVVSGFAVGALGYTEADVQTYSLAEGRAYVEGRLVVLQSARRLTYEAIPDTELIQSEPHLSATAGAQRIVVNHPAIAEIVTANITNKKTVTVTHGAYAGVSDALPDASVIQILSVTQGAMTYPGTAYALSSGAIDWSPSGAEPATGSTYSVTYLWIEAAIPSGIDLKGFNVTGAEPGTLVLVTYRAKMPRIDRLCLSSSGAVVWVKGVPSLIAPALPAVPPTLLPIATVRQAWFGDLQITGDGPRTVSMAELSHINSRIDSLYQRMAEHRLLSDVSVRDSGLKRGIFVDPFVDDSLRDAGLTQTAAIVGGELILPISTQVKALPNDVATTTTFGFSGSLECSQDKRTGAMKINPYGAQIAPPVEVSIDPAIDRWTESTSNWASPLTERILNDPRDSMQYYWRVGEESSTEVRTAGTTSSVIWYLRQIPVTLNIAGFGAGEQLDRLYFDGVDVTPMPKPIAAADGKLSLTFTIPPSCSAGVKRIRAQGTVSYGETTFYGEGSLTTTTQQSVTTIRPRYVISFTNPNAGTETPAGSGSSGGSGGSGGSGEYTSTIGDPSDGPPPGMSVMEWLTRRRIAEASGTSCIVDPLAQTFRVSRHRQVFCATLQFVVTGTHPVVLQIRGTAQGLPTGNILAEARMTPAPGVNTFIFSHPADLFPDTEYALVVMTDSQVHQVAVAELGKFDAEANQWVTSQPYDVGTLLSSADAQSWLPHPDRDLWFKLYCRNYFGGEAEIPLGSVNVVNASDLVLLADDYAPAPGAGVYYQLQLPGGDTRNVSDGQRIALATPITGVVAVKARIQSTSDLSGVLHRGTSLVVGSIQASGTYITRAISAVAGDKLTVIYDAVVPAGAGVVAEYQLDGVGAWHACAAPTGRPADLGATELTSVNSAIGAESHLRVRLSLSGSAGARPKVRNLRALVTQPL